MHRQITSGGEHLYFTAPSDSRIRNSAGRLGWLIDVRAAGGYVVAAGSVIRNRRYRAAEAEVQELPAWIAKQLEGSARQALTLEPLLDVAGRRSRYVAAALRGELDAVLAAQPGSGCRNDTLDRAAFALGQLVGASLLPEGLATAALAEASAAIGLPPREAHATIRSGLVAGIQRPRRLPAVGSAE